MTDITQLTTDITLTFVLLLGMSLTSTAETTQSDPTPSQTSRIDVAPIPRAVFLRAGNDPTDEVWKRVPEHLVQLQLAPAVHQSVALRQNENLDTGPVPLHVGVISDGHKIYFRLRWKDNTRNATNLVGTYRDAAAVRFPRRKDTTSVMMGGAETPVDIWFWKADTNSVESLTAKGPGTVAPSSGPTTRGHGVYQERRNSEGGQWLVAFSRDVEGNEERVLTAQSGSVPVAFAVWHGDKEQRDGHKYVSDWIELGLRR